MGLYTNVYDVQTEPGADHPMVPDVKFFESSNEYILFLAEKLTSSDREVVRAIHYRLHNGFINDSNRTVTFSGPFVEEAKEFLKHFKY